MYTYFFSLVKNNNVHVDYGDDAEYYITVPIIIIQYSIGNSAELESLQYMQHYKHIENIRQCNATESTYKYTFSIMYKIITYRKMPL